MEQAASGDPVDYRAVAATLAQGFARTAAERDARGGTPFPERAQIRESGLLTLLVPRELGGAGQSWSCAFAIVRELARADSSLAHVYGYHHLGVTTPHFYGTAAQRERYYAGTARNNWFWCNAINPLDRRLTLTPDGTGFRLNGTKSYSSGSVDSDIIPVTAVREGHADLAVIIAPSDRAGIIVNDDWDNMGQRQTDSGSITFDNVAVTADEILERAGSAASAFGTLRSCLTQLTFVTIYQGIAEGALDAARNYTATSTRTWPASGVDSATHDPYILRHYGEMWTGLQGSGALTDRAISMVDEAWQLGEALTATQRGACALAVATAKIAATRSGLEITSRIFEVMGARATAAHYGFDRFWRNLRTFTLHDPVDYKLRDVGNWVLTGQLPTPGFYS